MRTIIVFVTTLLLPAVATAQDFSLSRICEGADVPTEQEYTDNPIAHADNFCALALYAPANAKAQLDKMIRTTRAQENRNRHYFDPKHGGKPGLFIQLLRPWMREENASGAANWRVIRRSSVEYDFIILNASAECRGEATAAGCIEMIVTFNEGDLLWFENGQTELGYQRLRFVYNDTPFFVPPPQGRAFKAVEVQECVEWYVDEMGQTDYGADVVFPGNCPHLDDAVAEHYDPTFDIALRALDYAPTGESPTEKIQRTMEAAKEYWEETILEGFPDQENVEVRALWPNEHNVDNAYHTETFSTDIDDLFIGYYVDPHLDEFTASTYSFNPSHDMPSGARRTNVSLIRWSASAVDRTRDDWLVKIAIHEIGHAIFLNYPSRDHNQYGGLWNRANDVWTGAGGVRAYREAGGEDADVPMESGVHWPWRFIDETSSGGDIMETRINSHAELGSITLSALRDYGYAVKDNVPAYQPLTVATETPGRKTARDIVVFECGTRGGYTR